jgi:hypothetical protein
MNIENNTPTLKTILFEWDRLSDELTYWIYVTTYLKIVDKICYVSISEILGKWHDSISDASS